MQIAEIVTRSRLAMMAAMSHRLPLAVVIAVTLTPPPLSAQEVLKRAGSLACLAAAEDASEDNGTSLTCELNLFGDKPQLRLKGTLHGRGLDLVEARTRRVVWSVLAPAVNVEPTAIAGSYDTKTAHNFPYVKERTDVLAGGMAGSIVLQLVSPTVDAIGPETRLEIHVAK